MRVLVVQFLFQLGDSPAQFRVHQRIDFGQRGHLNARLGDGTESCRVDHIGDIAVGDLIALPCCGIRSPGILPARQAPLRIHQAAEVAVSHGFGRQYCFR